MTIAALGRRTHLFVIGVFSSTALLSVWMFPDVWKDAPTGWSSFGVFATLAGLTSALYEISRASSAAQMAEKQASEAISKIRDINEIISSFDCKSLISISISEIKNDGRANHTNIMKILSYYRKSVIPRSTSDRDVTQKHCDLMASHIAGDKKLGLEGKKEMCEALVGIYQDCVDVEKAPEGARML